MNDPAQQPVPQIPVDQASQPPVVPAATPHKEAEPIATHSQAPDEFIQPSENIEPAITPEVAEAGVEVVSERPPLPDAAQKLGVTHAKESTPVQTQPTGQVQLPMTKQQAHQTLKLHKKVTDSIVWLAFLILRQFKITHQKPT